jgi:hypothetical protein
MEWVEKYMSDSKNIIIVFHHVMRSIEKQYDVYPIVIWKFHTIKIFVLYGYMLNSLQLFTIIVEGDPDMHTYI